MQRLTRREVSILALDTQHTPAHVGTVEIFEAPGSGSEFDYEALVTLIRERLSFVPRYRMRIRTVPGSIAAPVWVEDEDFDLTYHVRRSALPRPGTMQQLREFVGRVMARRLDRSRPLWEVYLLEGLEGNRFALVAKSHECLVDGVDTVDLGQVLVDETPVVDPDENAYGDAMWEPRPEPRPIDLVLSALQDNLGNPETVIETTRRAITGALGTAVAIGEAVGGVGGTVGGWAGSALRGGRAPSNSPLSGPLSEQRRFATVSMPLADIRALRISDQYTVNDVVMALIAGGLRSWLDTRGEPVRRPELWALVPMSVPDEDGAPTSLGSKVAPHLMALPVGEPNALMRLHQVSFGTRAHKETGRAVDARSITGFEGFAPTTLHMLGVRAGGEVVRKPHDLLITNAPGPQHPLYVAGAEMVASYPVLPLAPGHLLSIGITSYNGEVYFGLNGDRDALGDLDILAQCLKDALAELRETAEHAAATRQPARNATPRRPSVTATKASGGRRSGGEGATTSATGKKSAYASEEDPDPDETRRQCGE